MSLCNRVAGPEVDLHFQFDGDAPAAVGELVNAHHASEIFLIDGAVARSIRVGDEQPHIFLVGGALTGKIHAVAANIQRVHHFVEVVAARLGRPHAHSLCKLGAPFSPAFRFLRQMVPLRDDLRRPRARSSTDTRPLPLIARKLWIPFSKFNLAKILRVTVLLLQTSWLDLYAVGKRLRSNLA